MDGRLLRSKQTKENLLKNAKEVFIENGFQKTTVSEIAKRAKVGYGTAYTHFKGKDEILITLMEDVMDIFYTIAATHYRPENLESAIITIRKQSIDFLSLARTERKILAVFYEARGFSKEIETTWKKIRKRFIKSIENDIAYVQSIGLGKNTINKEVMAKAWFYINEMFLWDLVQTKNPSQTIEEIADTLVEFYTTGMYVST